MIKDRKIVIAKSSMLMLNFIAIIFMSNLVYKAIQTICSNNLARDFLEKISYIPTVPWKVPFYAVVFMLLLVCSTLIKDMFLKEKKTLLHLFYVVDLLICIALIYCTNLSYKGVLLLAIMNVITSVEGKKKRNIFVAMAIIIYVIFDYDIISLKISILSINDYIQYFSPVQRLYIYSIRNVLSSLNEMIFIVFMIFVIQKQVDENIEIKVLYEQLYATAEELKIANIRLEQYNKKSEEMVKTRERNRLAREIHDTIGHTFTAIATGLEACSELIGWDLEKTKAQISKISELARNGLLDVRRSVSELRPDVLERFSLVPAIKKLAESISDCTSTKVHLNVEGFARKLRADEEETLYRVVQECITNAVRHGKAREICVYMNFTDSFVGLEISDNGKGCDNIKEGFGLTHIRERVEMLKGSARFMGNRTNGFSVQVDMPIRWG